MTLTQRLTPLVGFLVVILLALMGCGHATAETALRTIERSKQGADTAIAYLRFHVEERNTTCEHLATPGNLAALNRCLGPVASKPNTIEAVLEGVRAAQLAAFAAFSTGDYQRFKHTVHDLTAAVAKIMSLADQARSETR